ncbi:hypothetical protein QAD02_010553 [Eretmocerus hayati]|uniref:Uncharacterized protein n=1 Tax=Eretmocerus hayati TaxID=131215 RepID=A0ACC2NUF6_9HYME|nr:hypothetical protein QAD02_010553 [Eretmocerus hayati]
MSIEEKNRCIEQGNHVRNCLVQESDKSIVNSENPPKSIESLENVSGRKIIYSDRCSKLEPKESGIFLYINLHGHVFKREIFMNGNHFEDPELSAICILLPELMSLNNPSFHFTSCNFAEKKYVPNVSILLLVCNCNPSREKLFGFMGHFSDERDSLSRKGSGRVAVYKHFGLIHSYSLECNHNTGPMVNSIPAGVQEGIQKIRGPIFVPPKYSPSVFEEVGVALGPSILDMTDENSNSRLPNSQYRSLKGLKSYLKLISTNYYQTSLYGPANEVNLAHSENDIVHVDGIANDEIRQCSLC